MAAVPLAISAKLGIKPGQRVVLVHPPADFALSDLPDEVSLSGGEAPPDTPADMVIGFFGAASDLQTEILGLARSIAPDGMLWLAWPRRAGGGQSDLTDNVVRRLGLSAGLVDVKVAALGQAWSSLRFVRPKGDRNKDS